MRRRTSTRIGAILATACGLGGLLVADTPPARAEESPRTLLAVFAHPDDEQTISPMLARYAREGVQVHVAFATGGQKGVRDHAGIPAGEALGTARAAEARCACEKLGVLAPILVDLEDGELYTEENKAALLKEVARLFAELKPDVVVTWGPDGVTGHTDHRMVSSVVSQVIQEADPDTAPRLFYAGLPAERLAALAALSESPGGGMPLKVAVVRTRYLPVQVPYGEEDARAATEALACHKSQYTPQEAAMMDGMARTLEGGVVRLRPWFVETETTSDLFE
jgi:LmbE family N-acetylglucosaminyl deacetylase